MTPPRLDERFAYGADAALPPRVLRKSPDDGPGGSTAGLSS
jgi:hypothetical protein